MRKYITSQCSKLSACLSTIQSGKLVKMILGKVILPLGRHLGNASGQLFQTHRHIHYEYMSMFQTNKTRLYLNEWAESQNCFFSGHRDIKTACIETAVRYNKNR